VPQLLPQRVLTRRITPSQDLSATPPEPGRDLERRFARRSQSAARPRGVPVENTSEDLVAVYLIALI
jgi:hypothetical protein